MSRNGSGTYSLPSGNPVVTGTTISSTWANNTLSDIATALTQSIASTGVTTPSANLPMGTFRHTSVGDASARNDYAAYGQVQDSAATWGGTAGGTANALTIAPTPAITAYAAGQRFTFLTGASANSSSATLAVSGLAAKSIVRRDNSALQAGDIPATTLLDVEYDGTSFRIVPPIATVSIVRTARTSDTVLASADRGKLIDVTSGTFTQTITAAATLGSGWFCYYRNSGTGIVTLDANASETVDGSTTVAIPPNIGFVLVCDGSNFFTIGRTNQSMTLLSVVTASSSATVDIETTFDSTYDEYLIVATNIAPATNAAVMHVRFKIGGSYITTGTYDYHVHRSNAAATTYAAAAAAAATSAIVTAALGDPAESSASIQMWVHNPASATLAKTVNWTGCSYGSQPWLATGAASNSGTSALTGVRFFMDSGNVARGTFRLYGIKNS